MEFPDDLLYTEEHEWIRYDESSDEATLGITDFAQSELGDIVFIEFPESGDAFSAGDAVGTIEAVKTVADIFAPVSGEVLEVNSHLDDAPEAVNDDPYGEGWLLRIKVNDADEMERLMSAEKYKEMVE